MDEDIGVLSSSILLSVKKAIGISEDDESFDLDIILNINAAISTLYQLGVLQRPFTVDSKDDTYASMYPDGKEDVLNQIKMYLIYKTRLGFDSATMSGIVMETLKEMIKEAEWRMMTAHNPDDTYEDI